MEIGFSKIVVGIDGSEESMKAAEYAISITKLYNAELNAITVLTSDIGYIYSSPGVESPPLRVKEIVLLAGDEAKKWFDEIKEKANKKGVQLKTVYCGQEVSIEHNIGIC
jgi:nucleotide-binding universal stress UspA family protein